MTALATNRIDNDWAVSNPYAMQERTARKQSEVKEEDDWGTWRWLSALGSATYEGARNGLMLDTPETFYRMTRTLGDMFGISSWQDWASQNLEEIKTAREQDPFYKVSADVMNDPYAKSVYGAISSLTNSFAIGAPGALIGMATGGVGFVPLLMGHSLMTGGLYGIAEYDSYVEDAYNAYKQVNPDLTWQQVQDEVNGDAVLSALAEGGLEVAGELLGGKLIGSAGKAVVGNMGTVKAWRSLPTKILKGMLAGQLTDTPSELLTSAIQADLRFNDGISTQTAAQAVQDQFGSILLASALGGGGGAITEHISETGKRNADIAKYQQELQQAQQNLEAEKQVLDGDNVINSLRAGDKVGILQSIKQKFVDELGAGEVYDKFLKRFLGKDLAPLPSSLDANSKEFQSWAKTDLEKFGLIHEVPMGRKVNSRIFLKTTGDLHTLYSDFLNGKITRAAKERRQWQLGKISPELAKSLKSNLGIDADSGYFTFNYSTLEHIKNRHPELTAEEFSLLPAVLTSFDKAPRFALKRSGKKDTTSSGVEKFILSKEINDNRYYACEVVSTGKDKRIELVSFYPDNNNKNINPPQSGSEARRSMPDSSESSPKLTSETHPGTTYTSPDSGGYNNPSSTDNSTTESDIINNISERFAKYLQGDTTDLKPHQIAQFEEQKQKLESEIKRASQYGVIGDMEVGRYSDMFDSLDLPRRATTEEHEKWVNEQLDVIAGKKKPSLDAADELNSSLLVPEMDDIVYRNDRMKVMADVLQRLKEKDKHTTERLLKLGAKAIANHTANPQVFRQFSDIYANHDVAIMAAGMLHEQMNRETNVALLEAKKSGRDEDYAYARLLMKASNEMTEVFSGIGTSAGRALRAVRTIKDKRGKELTQALKDVIGSEANQNTGKMISQIMTNLVEQAQPKDKGQTTKVAELQKEVKAILEKESPHGLSDEDMGKLQELFENTNYNELTATVKLKSRYSRIRDAVIESTIAGMLTGPATHIVNTLSGTASIASEIHDRLFAGMMYKGARFAGGFGETMAMLHGITDGFVDAIHSAVTAFKTGQSRWGGDSEKAGQQVHGVSTENGYSFFKGSSTDMTLEEIEADATGGLAKVAKLVSQGFGLVGAGQRLLSTNTMLMSDEFMKTLVYHMQRRALAHRAMQTATRQGQDGQAAYNAIMDGEIAPPEIHEQIMNYASYITFQDQINQDTTGGKFWKSIDNARKAMPETMLVMPFLKTPLNIAKWVGTRTPGIANLFSEYREAMSNNGDMAKKQLAEARMLTGSLLWNVALVMASEGILTGSGPTDKKEKEKLYATGWRPNSLHVGDTYYELTRLDPIATFLNTMASFVEIASDLDDADLSEVAAATLGSALKVASDKYYLSGISDFLNAVRESDRYGKTYLSRLGSNVVPFSGLRRTAARGLDPVMREARDFVEIVKKDTPIASYSAAMRRTILGELVKYDGGGLFRAITPIRTSKDNHDPVYDELLRLQQNSSLNISYPQRRLNINGKSVKLDTHQYSKYLELAGQEYRVNGLNAKDALQQLFKNSSYQMQPDTVKGRLTEQIIRNYRYKARNSLIESDEKLQRFNNKLPRLAALL